MEVTFIPKKILFNIEKKKTFKQPFPSCIKAHNQTLMNNITDLLIDLLNDPTAKYEIEQYMNKIKTNKNER